MVADNSLIRSVLFFWDIERTSVDFITTFAMRGLTLPVSLSCRDNHRTREDTHHSRQVPGSVKKLGVASCLMQRPIPIENLHREITKAFFFARKCSDDSAVKDAGSNLRPGRFSSSLICFANPVKSLLQSDFQCSALTTCKISELTNQRIAERESNVITTPAAA